MGDATFFLIILFLLLLHFVMVVLVWLYSARAGNLRWEYIIPIGLVPIFGPGLAITIELLYKYGTPGDKPVELEALKLDNDIYWNTFKEPEEDSDVIPLEEAILLNDPTTRRKAVLDTFRYDSTKYMDVLKVARTNEDVDTTHYATIRITMTQRDFENDLQKLAAAHNQCPTDLTLLSEYINLLEKYIDSELADYAILHIQRKLYMSLLNEKLALLDEEYQKGVLREHFYKRERKQTLVRKLRVCNDLQEDCEDAENVVSLLKQEWPDDEQTWIEALRMCVEWRNVPCFHETVEQISGAKNIAWTRQGKAQVRPWVQL